MKRRDGFVSNSSASSFVITNTSNRVKTLLDFVVENRHLIERYNRQYAWCCPVHADLTIGYTLTEVLASLQGWESIHGECVWQPGESKHCIFGDHDVVTIGQIYDYILRDGGKSDNFEWKFHESLR